MPNLAPLKSRLPQVGTTIFTVMSALAQVDGSVLLGQGGPHGDDGGAHLGQPGLEGGKVRHWAGSG
ncbi:MAG: hypothetical protein ACKOE3_06000, partial [Betaproteobacteria bacterium]